MDGVFEINNVIDCCNVESVPLFSISLTDLIEFQYL